MLEKLLRHLRNWFVLPDGIHPGEYKIEKGSITLPFLIDGQYFRIIGSFLNDGVYRYPADELKNETFSGTIWALAVPSEVVEMSREIEAWVEKHPVTPYTSESYGGYSYSKAVSGRTGQAVGWQDAFRDELNQWRKI